VLRVCEVVGWHHLLILIPWTVKWYIITLFKMLFWNFRIKSKTRWSVYSSVAI